jgi:hypothetical protein
MVLCSFRWGSYGRVKSWKNEWVEARAHNALGVGVLQVEFGGPFSKILLGSPRRKTKMEWVKLLKGNPNPNMTIFHVSLSLHAEFLPTFFF